MRIGMGCVGLGTPSGGRTYGADVRLVRSAIDRGVTVLDTAAAYGHGMSERIIGSATRGRRGDVVLATKGGYVVRPRSRPEFVARREALRTRALLGRVRPTGEHTGGGAQPVGGGQAGTNYAAQDFSPAALRRSLDDSLRRLRTDHVDVFQLHGPPEVMPDVVPALRSLVDAGKTRKLGVGAESLAAAEAWSRVDGIDVVQLPVGILDPRSRQLAAEISARGREVWARAVFGGGLLAAAVSDVPSVHEDPKWPLIVALRALGAEHGVGLFELAYGFVRAVPGVTTVLLGMSRPSHLAENLSIAGAAPLSDDLLGAIDATLAAVGAGGAPE